MRIAAVIANSRSAAGDASEGNQRVDLALGGGAPFVGSAPPGVRCVWPSSAASKRRVFAAIGERAGNAQDCIRRASVPSLFLPPPRPARGFIVSPSLSRLPLALPACQGRT